MLLYETSIGSFSLSLPHSTLYPVKYLVEYAGQSRTTLSRFRPLLLTSRCLSQSLLLDAVLVPRALGSEESTYEGPPSTEESGKQGTKIGVILGCVFVVTLGTVFAVVGLLVRRKRRKDAGSSKPSFSLSLMPKWD